MRPEKHNKKDLSRNNFDDGKSFQDQKRLEGKLDTYIKVDFPKSDPNLKKEKDGNRDVYRYQGDVNLGDYNHEFGKHPGK